MVIFLVPLHVHRPYLQRAETIFLSLSVKDATIPLDHLLPSTNNNATSPLQRIHMYREETGVYRTHVYTDLTLYLQTRRLFSKKRVQLTPASRDQKKTKKERQIQGESDVGTQNVR